MSDKRLRQQRIDRWYDYLDMVADKAGQVLADVQTYRVDTSGDRLRTLMQVEAALKLLLDMTADTQEAVRQVK